MKHRRFLRQREMYYVVNSSPSRLTAPSTRWKQSQTPHGSAVTDTQINVVKDIRTFP